MANAKRTNSDDERARERAIDEAAREAVANAAVHWKGRAVYAEAELVRLRRFEREAERLRPIVEHIAGMIDPGDNYGMIHGQLIRDAKQALAR